MQTSIQCYVKGDRASLPMSIKLIEMSTVICYLRSHCEVKAETLLEDKTDKHWTISFCLSMQTHTHIHTYAATTIVTIFYSTQLIPLAAFRIRVFIFFGGGMPIDYYIHDFLCIFKILEPSF